MSANENGVSFQVMRTLSGAPRVEISPDDLVALVRSLSVPAVEALMCLFSAEPDVLSGSFDDWLGALGSKGIAAHRGGKALRELLDKGYLRVNTAQAADARQNDYKPVTTPPRPPATRCRVCQALRLEVPHHASTYAVRRQGYVKIGTTTDVRQRLKALRRGGVVVPSDMDIREPLSLLGVTGAAEHDLHERFAGDHAVGEWFHATERVLSELRTLLDAA